jgi:hypothetical protein
MSDEKRDRTQTGHCRGLGGAKLGPQAEKRLCLCRAENTDYFLDGLMAPTSASYELGQASICVILSEDDEYEITLVWREKMDNAHASTSNVGRIKNL